jgi:hypothetical protein
MTRKLDTLVATEVMGWKYRQDAPEKQFCLGFGNDRGWWQRPEENDWYCAMCEDAPPFYSDDIAAAWQVVEKLLTILPHQDIHIEHLEHSGWQIGTCFNQQEGGWDDWVSGDTISLAICLAALKAVGVGNATIEETTK